MRIRTATLDELNQPVNPQFSLTQETHCWCARPGGCRNKIDPGRPGRLCEFCLNERHPILNAEAIINDTP